VRGIPVALGKLEAVRGKPDAERRLEVVLRRLEVVLRMLERHMAGAGRGRLELDTGERVELDSLKRGQRSLLGSGNEGYVPPLI
jgi:hypothetical protein